MAADHINKNGCIFKELRSKSTFQSLGLESSVLFLVLTTSNPTSIQLSAKSNSVILEYMGIKCFHLYYVWVSEWECVFVGGGDEGLKGLGKNSKLLSEYKQQSQLKYKLESLVKLSY